MIGYASVSIDLMPSIFTSFYVEDFNMNTCKIIYINMIQCSFNSLTARDENS